MSNTELAGFTPWLDPMPLGLHQMALDALAARDAFGFLRYAENTERLLLVAKNRGLLQYLGIYEAALLEAFTASRTNNHPYPAPLLRDLFARADRARLRAAGTPLPRPGPHTLYRGVTGRGAARRIRGWSWTSDLARAWWFARRFEEDLPCPAVYQATVPTRNILAYSNEREEEEYIVMMPARFPVSRVRERPETAAPPPATKTP